MKDKFINNVTDWRILLIVVALLAFSSCSKKTSLREKICPQIVDAYNDADWDKILILIDSLIANNYDVEDLFIPHAEALAATQQTDKAIEILNNTVKKYPDNDYAFHELGNVYWIKKDYDKAIDNYKRAVEISPGYARPYLYMAEIYKIQGEKNNAIDNYMKAVRLFAEHEYFDEVKQYTNAILNLDSTNIQAYKHLSFAYHAEGNHKAVIACSMEILRLAADQNSEKEFYETSIFLGLSLYKCGEYEKAVYFLEQALNDEETWRNYSYLAYCYLSAAYNKLNDEIKSAGYRDLAEKMEEEKAKKYIEELISKY